VARDAPRRTSYPKRALYQDAQRIKQNYVVCDQSMAPESSSRQNEELWA
jgi:hypothetical protein